MIWWELAGLLEVGGRDLGRAVVITGLGFAAVGTTLGILAGSAFGPLRPGGVLHPVITTPTVPTALARSVRRSKAPSSRPISIPEVEASAYGPDRSSQPRRPLSGRVLMA